MKFIFNILFFISIFLKTKWINLIESKLIKFSLNNSDGLVQYEKNNYFGNKIQSKILSTSIKQFNNIEDSIEELIIKLQSKQNTNGQSILVFGCDDKYFKNDTSKKSDAKKLSKLHKELKINVLESLGETASVISEFKSLPNLGMMIIKFKSNTNSDSMKEVITNIFDHNDKVWFIEVLPEFNFTTSNLNLNSNTKQLLYDDDIFKQQWHLFNPSNPDADVSATYLWYATRCRPKKKVTVAVLDTGLDMNISSLKSVYWNNPSEIPDNGIDDDDNGYIDDVHGWNFITNTNIITDQVDLGNHGTLCSLILGSRPNHGYPMGISQNVKIMGLPFILEGSTSPGSLYLEALEYTLEKNIKISTNSFGLTYNTDPSEDLVVTLIIENIYFADQLFIFAAGNDNINFGQETEHYHLNQFVSDFENVIIVGANNNDGRKYTKSNYGSPTVHCFAPGEDIITGYSEGTFSTASGTSQSAPIVAGIAAEIMSVFPSITPTQLKEAILESCTVNENILPSSYSTCGGIVDAYKAYKKILEQETSITPL